jgi:hypothetical protein
MIAKLNMVFCPMPQDTVAFIVELSEDAVQPPHAEGEIAVRGFDKEMIVVCHEAVCVADPVTAFIDVLESVQKIIAVLFVLEDRLFLVSPGGHVMDCSGISKLLQRQRIESSILAEEFIVFAR